MTEEWRKNSSPAALLLLTTEIAVFVAGFGAKAELCRVEVVEV